jgi:hypothetical protein
VLKEWAVQRDHETVEFSARFSRGAADFVRLADTVEAIRASGPRPSPAVLPSPRTPARSVPSVPVTPKCPFVRGSARSSPTCFSAPVAPAGFASLIVADCPEVFAELRGKGFPLALIQDTAGNFFGASRWWSGTHTAIERSIRV